MPTTPWTDEAVPAIGAICSIASVPRLDEVKAKQAIVSALQDDEQPPGVSPPAQRDRGVDDGDEREAPARRHGRPGAARSARRSAQLVQDASAIGAATAANTSPISSGALEGVEHDLLDRGDVGDQRRRR